MSKTDDVSDDIELFDDVEEKEEKKSDNEPSGLASMATIKSQTEKFQKQSLCPKCGTDNTEKHKYYYRCHNDDCDTITFVSSNFELDMSNFW